MAGLNWRCGLWWNLPLIWASRIDGIHIVSLIIIIIDYVINQHGSSRVINLSDLFEAYLVIVLRRVKVFRRIESIWERDTMQWEELSRRQLVPLLGQASQGTSPWPSRMGLWSELWLVDLHGSPSDCWVVSWYIVARNTDLKCGSMRSTMHVFSLSLSVVRLFGAAFALLQAFVFARWRGIYIYNYIYNIYIYIHSTRIGNEKDSNVHRSQWCSCPVRYSFLRHLMPWMLFLAVPKQGISMDKLGQFTSIYHN